MRKISVLALFCLVGLALPSCGTSDQNADFPWLELTGDLDYGEKISNVEAQDIYEDIVDFISEMGEGYSALDFPFFSYENYSYVETDDYDTTTTMESQYSLEDFFCHSSSSLISNGKLATKITVDGVERDVYISEGYSKFEDWSFKNDDRLINVSHDNSSALYYYDAEDDSIVNYIEPRNESDVYDESFDEGAYLEDISSTFDSQISVAMNLMSMFSTYIEMISTSSTSVPGIEFYSSGEGNLLLHISMNLAGQDMKSAYYIRNNLPSMSYSYIDSSSTGILESCMTWDFSSFEIVYPSYSLD